MTWLTIAGTIVGILVGVVTIVSVVGPMISKALREQYERTEQAMQREIDFLGRQLVIAGDRGDDYREDLASCKAELAACLSRARPPETQAGGP